MANSPQFRAPPKQALSGFKRSKSNVSSASRLCLEQLCANLDIGTKSCPIVVSLFHYRRLAELRAFSVYLARVKAALPPTSRASSQPFDRSVYQEKPVPRVPDFILATIPIGIYAKKGIYLTFNSAIPRKRSHWAVFVYPAGVREQLAEQSLHQFLYLLRAP
jgi:hypothetical protein